MRKLTQHIVPEDEQSSQIEVIALDKPGPGGAHHWYLIATPHDPEGIKQGCQIHFQKGPIKVVGVNGITQVSLLAVVIDCLKCFQIGEYACSENAEALEHLEKALDILHQRTRDRIKRGVEDQNKK